MVRGGVGGNAAGCKVGWSPARERPPPPSPPPPPLKSHATRVAAAADSADAERPAVRSGRCPTALVVTPGGSGQPPRHTAGVPRTAAAAGVPRPRGGGIVSAAAALPTPAPLPCRAREAPAMTGEAAGLPASSPPHRPQHQLLGGGPRRRSPVAETPPAVKAVGVTLMDRAHTKKETDWIYSWKRSAILDPNWAK